MESKTKPKRERQRVVNGTPFVQMSLRLYLSSTAGKVVGTAANALEPSLDMSGSVRKSLTSGPVVEPMFTVVVETWS